MSERVRITDVSPRDGLQNEPRPVPTSDKLRLIELLTRTGVDEIEATSFVSPRWIPQLADAEELLQKLPELFHRLTVSPSHRLTSAPPLLSVLVPNEKGFERALAFHTPDRPLKIALFTAASETFNQKNTNATIAESIERFRPIIPRAIAAAMPIRIYISCAIACPFEGPIAPAQVRKVADQFLALTPSSGGAIDLDLADTIGVAHPRDIEALLREFEDILRTGIVTLHLHDTFARAAVCIRTALDMGVRSFDGASGGLGGCPYASTPAQRAPGNIATETLVRTIHGAGFTTGVNEEALAEAAAFARTLVSR